MIDLRNSDVYTGIWRWGCCGAHLFAGKDCSKKTASSYFTPRGPVSEYRNGLSRLPLTNVMRVGVRVWACDYTCKIRVSGRSVAASCIETHPRIFFFSFCFFYYSALYPSRHKSRSHWTQLGRHASCCQPRSEMHMWYCRMPMYSHASRCSARNARYQVNKCCNAIYYIYINRSMYMMNH